jgi:hypothetical protein
MGEESSGPRFDLIREKVKSNSPRVEDEPIVNKVHVHFYPNPEREEKEKAVPGSVFFSPLAEVPKVGTAQKLSDYTPQQLISQVRSRTLSSSPMIQAVRKDYRKSLPLSTPDNSHVPSNSDECFKGFRESEVVLSQTLKEKYIQEVITTPGIVFFIKFIS